VAASAAFAICSQREIVGCGSNIVSSTVVATFCGHRVNDDEMLDVLILWRGRPGWFQRRQAGVDGSGGTNEFGAGTKGHVSQHSTYGNVTIGFDADFDANIVIIGDARVPISGVNTVLVDDVDEPGARRIVATRWTEPRLPLIGDMNLVLAQRSPDLLAYLRCEIPMPAPPPMRAPVPQVAVVTVCEKLKSK
jgi:hypothetical protein